MKKGNQMNFLKNALLVLMLIIPMGVFAQSGKLGHVKTQDLYTQMPEVTAANKQLDTLNKQYTEELKSLYDEYQKMLAAYTSLPTGTSDAIKKNKETALQQMQDRIQQFQEQAQQDLQKKNEELLTPIQKKVKDAIAAVAKEGSFIYVFDADNPALLYVAPSEDITPLVKKKLGIKP